MADTPRQRPEDVRVECYSGHTYAQAPRAFTRGGERHQVVEIERSWRSPDGPVFGIRTAEGARWELSYEESTDSWRARPLT